MTSPSRNRSPWPARPYKGFGSYGPEDAPLFAGRDDDITDFGDLVTNPEVRAVLLHGLSGCGKSSFLRAGAIPFLEKLGTGIVFPKDPDSPNIVPTGRNENAVLIRATPNPLEALAAAVFRMVDKPYESMSSAGPVMRSFAAAKLGHASIDTFVSSVAADPLRLIASLETLAETLPYQLYLVVDQAEEVVTQGARWRTDDHARAFFTFLDAFIATRWPLTLIISLRTEFFGIFRSRWRGPTAVQGVDDYFLDELSRDDIIEAIVRPTLTKAVREFGVPREHYHFAFEEGLPERIADDLAKTADSGGLLSGILPFIQVVCESLYKTTRHRGQDGREWTITSDDAKLGHALETMSQYVDELLDARLSGHVESVELARWRWKDVLATLAKSQPDGSVTATLRSVDELREEATRIGAPRFDDMVRYLADDEQSLLRLDRVAKPRSMEPSARYSLRHDAIGLVLTQWRAQSDRVRQDRAFKEVAQDFIPQVDEVQMACVFDEAGTGRVVRRFLGVSTQQTVVDYRIPYGFQVSDPGRATVPLVTALPAADGSLHPVQFVQTDSGPRGVKGHVEIVGRLNEGEHAGGFEIRQQFERAFLMSRTAVIEAYDKEEWKTEYASIVVQLPTQRLTLSVTFPPSFVSPNLEAGIVVFFGSSEKVHQAEVERIRPNFMRLEATATLFVDDPLPGLQYGIFWIPPG